MVFSNWICWITCKSGWNLILATCKKVVQRHGCLKGLFFRFGHLFGHRFVCTVIYRRFGNPRIKMSFMKIMPHKYITWGYYCINYSLTVNLSLLVDSEFYFTKTNFDYVHLTMMQSTSIYKSCQLVFYKFCFFPYLHCFVNDLSCM